MPEPADARKPDGRDEPAGTDEALETPGRAGARSRRRPSRIGGQLLAAVLVGVLGFAITVQVQRDDEEDGYSSMRGVELVELLKSVDAANSRLSGQVDELTRTRDDLVSARDSGQQAQRQAELRAEQLAVLSGSVGAVGPGVRLRIDDPEKVVDAAALLDVVEELRAAGAEAIVVDETARVVAQTYFLDDEGGVRVGGREVGAPYVIEAIGDAQTLREALEFRGGVVDRLAQRGAQAQVETVERLTVTALADVRSPEYARPDLAGDDAPTTP